MARWQQTAVAMDGAAVPEDPWVAVPVQPDQRQGWVLGLAVS
jgi:hypothetical protein